MSSGLAFCSRLMIIRNGATNRSPAKPAVRIVPCAVGDGGGPSDIASLICRDRVPPGVFPPEARAEATALACSLPSEHGLPLARWSCAEIATRLVILGVVASIAVSTVSRWLAAEKLKPWRYHTWQHILNPAAFLEAARPILTLYAQARALLAAGCWLVCVDEKTSIQARQAERPPAAGKSGQRLSPRYQRHGAVQLFAGLSVAEGRVYGQCRARKRFVDFQAFLVDTIIPAALQRGVHTLALILDNGSTHAPKRLDRWLQDEVKRNAWPLQVQIYWLPKNASWLDQIEIWFSLFQRKLLQPNHFDTLLRLEEAIMAFISHYNESAKPIHWTYTLEKLQLKLGMN